MRNFDFNRYTPRSKKLLRASLKRATNKIQGSLSFLGDLSMRAWIFLGLITRQPVCGLALLWDRGLDANASFISQFFRLFSLLPCVRLLPHFIDFIWLKRFCLGYLALSFLIKNLVSLFVAWWSTSLSDRCPRALAIDLSVIPGNIGMLLLS